VSAASCGLRALALAGGLALGACSLEPPYTRPALPVADAYPDGAAAAPGEARAAADLGWRAFLLDERLQRLVEAALRNNRDMRVAILNVEAMRAQYLVERSGLFPQVGASVVGARGRGDLSLFTAGTSVADVFEAYASVSWELDLFGQVRSLAHAALERYLASVEARKAAQILLVSEVATQYLTLVAADEAMAVTADSLRIAEESYRLTQLQYAAGTGSELDLRESEGAVEQARAQLASEQRAQAQARNALVLLLGAPLPPDLPPGRPLNEALVLADIPAGLPSDLLARRPDIVQAEHELIAAHADIGVARAAFFPSISLTGAAGAINPVLGHLLRGGPNAWGIEPGATLPLFTGGLNTANLEQAKNRRDIAVAQYEKSIQTAFREVADGLNARSTYEDQVAALERQVKAQLRRLDLARLRYRTGVDSYLTLLVAQNDLNAAQLSLVSTRLGRLVNLVTLYQDLGGGWIEQGGASEPSSRSAASGPAAEAMR
jgi:multidrug efflux system outer membrane protein